MWFRGDILFCYDLYHDLQRELKDLDESKDSSKVKRDKCKDDKIIKIEEEIENIRRKVQIEIEVKLLKKYINNQFCIDLSGSDENSRRLYKALKLQALHEETKKLLEACDCELVQEIRGLDIEVEGKNYNLIEYMEEWYGVLAEWKWALYKRYQLKSKNNKGLDESLLFLLLGLLDTPKVEDKQRITWLEKINVEAKTSGLSKYKINKIREFIDFYPQDYEFRLILLDDLLGITFDNIYQNLINSLRWQVHSQNLELAKKRNLGRECDEAKQLLDELISLLRYCPIFIGHLVLEGIMGKQIVYIECPNHPSKENMDEYISNLKLAIRFFQILLIKGTVDLDRMTIKFFPKDVTDDFITERESEVSRLIERIFKTTSMRNSMLESLSVFDKDNCREPITHGKGTFFENDLFALKGNKDLVLVIIKYYYTNAMLESGKKILSRFMKERVDENIDSIKGEMYDTFLANEKIIQNDLKNFALGIYKENFGKDSILLDCIESDIKNIASEEIHTIARDDEFISQLIKKGFRTLRRNEIGIDAENGNNIDKFWRKLLPDEVFVEVDNDWQALCNLSYKSTIIPILFEDWIKLDLNVSKGQARKFRRVFMPMIWKCWEIMVELKEKDEIPRKIPVRPFVEEKDGNIFLDMKNEMMAMDWVEKGR